MRDFLFWWAVCMLAALVGGGVAAMWCYSLTFGFIGLSALGGFAIWLMRRK